MSGGFWAGTIAVVQLEVEPNRIVRYNRLPRRRFLSVMPSGWGGIGVVLTILAYLSKTPTNRKFFHSSLIPNSAVEIFTEAKVARSVEHQMATEG